MLFYVLLGKSRRVTFNFRSASIGVKLLSFKEIQKSLRRNERRAAISAISSLLFPSSSQYIISAL